MRFSLVCRSSLLLSSCSYRSRLKIVVLLLRLRVRRELRLVLSVASASVSDGHCVRVATDKQFERCDVM